MKNKIEIDESVNLIKAWEIPRPAVPKIITAFIPVRIKIALESLYLSIMDRIKFKKEHIHYSRSWYENVYHSADIYYLPERNYEEVMMDVSKNGQKQEIEDIFKEFNLDVAGEVNWLEVACHHGKIPFLLANKYLNAHFFMFDFSEVAVEWCKRYNPIGERAIIWDGDVRKIHCGVDKFDDFFDVVTCFDVTEHLPDKIYRKAIGEIHRVCKIGGILLLRQGNVPLREHINILNEDVLVNDFNKTGFEKIDTLPHRCHVFKKNI